MYRTKLRNIPPTHQKVRLSEYIVMYESFTVSKCLSCDMLVVQWSHAVFALCLFLVAMRCRLLTGDETPHYPPSPVVQQELFSLGASGIGSATSNGDVRQVRLPDATESRIAELVEKFPNLQGVWLDAPKNRSTPIPPEGIRHLDRLAELTILHLHTNCSDLQADAVSRLTSLEELSFEAGDITNRGIAKLGRLTSIKSLSLSSDLKESRTATDEVFAAIIRRFPRLTRLQLTGSGITKGTFREVSRLQELESLALHVPGTVSADDVGDIPNLKRLSAIDFRFSGKNGKSRNVDDVVKSLGAIQSLRKIYLSAQHTDAGTAHLSRLTKLHSFETLSTNITDASLASLHNMSDLRELRLSSSKISGVGLAYLSTQLKLSELSLHGTGLKPENVQYLAKLHSLEAIDVGWTPVAMDDHWKALSGLKDLRSLKRVIINLDNASTLSLQEMLPQCQVIQVD